MSGLRDVKLHNKKGGLIVTIQLPLDLYENKLPQIIVWNERHFSVDPFALKYIEVTAWLHEKRLLKLNPI